MAPRQYDPGSSVSNEAPPAPDDSNFIKPEGNSELKTEVASDKVEVDVPRTRTKTIRKKEK